MINRSKSSFMLTAVASSVVALCASSASLAQSTPPTVDKDIPSYERVSGVSGNLNSIGSDTLNNLMTLWAEGFNRIYPNVNVQIEGKGSSTAPVALIEGTAQLGPMSRPMRGGEIDRFEQRFGYKPTEVRVAIDALAVFVHKDNPIKSLSMQQVDSIFSNTRRLGGTTDLTLWGQVGMTGEWARRPISLFGRNSASGTYGLFKEVALGGGDFRAAVKEQPGSSSVVQGIAADLAGIGYSGIGYGTAGVRALPLAGSDGTAYEPNPENCLNGNYPLARFLLVYVNKRPNAPMDTLTREFMKFVVSKEGQEVVVRDGYFPMNAAITREVVKQLEN